jgi:hypothetical protein
MAAAVAAATLLAVTACSASKPVPYSQPTTQSPAPTGPTASAVSPLPTAPQTPLPEASGQLTGTQLRTALLPQSSFPSGFAGSSTSVVTSGGSLTSSPARYDLATMSCASFEQRLGNQGFGETAMASDSIVGQSQAFDQIVYQFSSASAASGFVTEINALAGRCHSFTATDNGTKGTFSMRAQAAPPVGGHSSLLLSQSGTIGGSALALDTLWSASGVDVFGAAAIGLGASAPDSPTTQAMVYALMKRQAAAAVLG